MEMTDITFLTYISCAVLEKSARMEFFLSLNAWMCAPFICMCKYEYVQNVSEEVMSGRSLQNVYTSNQTSLAWVSNISKPQIPVNQVT